MGEAVRRYVPPPLICEKDTLSLGLRVFVLRRSRAASFAVISPSIDRGKKIYEKHVRLAGPSGYLNTHNKCDTRGHNTAEGCDHGQYVSQHPVFVGKSVYLIGRY
jgi:hypothetical protein